MPAGRGTRVPRARPPPSFPEQTSHAPGRHSLTQDSARGFTIPVSRFPGGVLCAAASVMLLLCAFYLSADESLPAGLCLSAVALGLLLAAVASLRAGMR